MAKSLHSHFAEINTTLLKRGHEQTVLKWCAVYSQPLLLFIQKRISNDQDAQELCQNTFLSCLESLPLFKETASLWTWMCAVARHEISDYFRKKYAKRVLQIIPFTEVFLPDHLSDMHEVAEAVRGALKKISARDQELLLMKYVDSLSVKDMAVRLGCSLKGVEASLYRARKAFQSAYDQ